MRHLLTTFAAAALVVGLGFAIAPAHAAPLPQLNGPSNQASPVEKIGYYGYLRLPASPLLLASPVLPALLRIRLLPALSLWLLEPALLSALVVVLLIKIRTGRALAGPDRSLPQNLLKPQ